MKLEYQILAAVALDLVLGDPRWLPHPVRGIGRLAAWLESLVHGSRTRCGRIGAWPCRCTLSPVAPPGASFGWPGWPVRSLPTPHPS